MKLSWRGVILEIARWPVVLWALVNVVLRIKRPYMITPKGVRAQRGLGAATIYGPYIFLTVVPLVALWTFHVTRGGGDVRGYFGLALANAALALAVLKATLILEIREVAADCNSVLTAMRTRAGVLLCALGLLGLLALSGVAMWAPMTRALS